MASVSRSASLSFWRRPHGDPAREQEVAFEAGGPAVPVFGDREGAAVGGRVLAQRVRVVDGHRARRAHGRRHEADEQGGEEQGRGAGAASDASSLGSTETVWVSEADPELFETVRVTS